MKAVLIGGLAALALGVGAGAFSQRLVEAVVSSDAGSRLEVASFAAPPSPTPWAEGDPTAPETLPVYAVRPAGETGFLQASWTAPAPPELAPSAERGAPAEPQRTAETEDDTLTSETDEEVEAEGPSDFGLDAFAAEPSVPSRPQDGLIVASSDF